jgi:hypothetical protein
MDAAQQRQRFDSYVRRSVPQIGWDHCERVGHFELIHNIHAGYPNYRSQIEKYAFAKKSQEVRDMIEREFRSVMSDSRRQLIMRCLERRHELLLAALSADTDTPS